MNVQDKDRARDRSGAWENAGRTVGKPMPLVDGVEKVSGRARRPRPRAWECGLYHSDVSLLCFVSQLEKFVVAPDKNI